MSFMQRLKESLSSFMQGRHGPDNLGMFTLLSGLVVSLLGSFTGVGSPKTPEGFSAESSQLSLLFRFNGGKDTAAEVWNSSNQLIDVIEARCGYSCAIFSRSGLDHGTYTLELGTLKASAEA